METVRFGVIGAGNMGLAHAKNLAEGKVRGATLAAVCDTDPERCRRARESLPEGVGIHETDEAFFDAGGVDVALITTPHYQHPPLAIQAFSRGMHVLCEKPAGVYTRQVREMNRAAEDSGKVFAMMFNVRTRPEYRKLHDLVTSGELGELKRAVWIITDWYRTQGYYDSGDWRATWAGEGGGVLLNQCPHQLDLWQWICGLPVRVRAFCHFGRYHDIEVEDDVTAYVEYENGATGLFVATTGEAPGTNRFELTGERGKIVLEEGKIRFWRTRVPVSEHCRTEPKGFKKPETWVCDIPTGRTPDGHVKIMQNVTDKILGKDELLAPGAEGIRSLEISNAMLLSAWTDDWAAIPVDEDRFDAELQKRVDGSAAKTNVRKQAMDLSDSFAS